MGEKADKKWSGSVSHVIGAPVEKTWSIVADFAGLQRHFPKIFQSCEIVEGEGNTVGSKRVVVKPMTTGPAIVVKERLVALDNKDCKFTYTMDETNQGWQNYYGYVAVQSAEKNQSWVQWSFEVDPVPNTSKEEYEAFVCHFVDGLLKDLNEQVIQK